MMRDNRYRLLKPLSYLIIVPMLISCGIVHPALERSEPGPERSADDPASMERFEVGAEIQEGIASWYGPNFQGRLTANGETYDMSEFTAAHRTLPFNTVVRVTNENNQKRVDVRINDRGPYIGDRIIDLSRAAAEEIDMVDAGLVNVTLELVEIGDREVTRSSASSRENFTVQLASFGSRSEAERESERISGSEIVEVQTAGQTFFRVYYGSFEETGEAERQLRQLRRRGYNGFVKQREN